MSVMNCVVADSAVHVFTDGGLWDRAGNLGGIGCKALPLPHLNAVIAATGVSWASLLLHSEIAETPLDGFDDLVQKLPKTARGCIKKYAADIGGQTWGNYSVMIAGWSTSRSRPEAYVMGVLEDRNRPPFVLARVESNFESLPVRRPPVAGDIALDGLALMERQRAIWCRDQDNPGVEYFAAGGFCQHTTIDRDGIAYRVLKRWPDKIGERVRVAPKPGRLFG